MSSVTQTEPNEREDIKHDTHTINVKYNISACCALKPAGVNSDVRLFIMCTQGLA